MKGRKCHQGGKCLNKIDKYYIKIKLKCHLGRVQFVCLFFFFIKLENATSRYKNNTKSRKCNIKVENATGR